MDLSDIFEEDIIQDYSNKICHHSRIGADVIKNYLADLEKDETSKRELGATEYCEILLEFVFFLLHFTDRCIFWEIVGLGYMNEEERDILMMELEERCINSAVDYGFFGLAESPKHKIKDLSFENFNIRIKEYSKYKKNFPDKDEGLRDTLFWEFSKNVAKFVGREPDPVLKLICTKVAVGALVDLDPKSSIKKLKR